METDSPSNSDEFEEVIYSQESPKSGETFRDFEWDEDRLYISSLEHNNPLTNNERRIMAGITIESESEGILI